MNIIKHMSTTVPHLHRPLKPFNDLGAFDDAGRPNQLAAERSDGQAQKHAAPGLGSQGFDPQRSKG